MSKQGTNSTPNPLQVTADRGYLGRIVAAVVFALNQTDDSNLKLRCRTAEPGFPFHVKLAQWPLWLERLVRREVAKVAKAHSNYVIAGLARKIVDLERELERVKPNANLNSTNEAALRRQPDGEWMFIAKDDAGELIHGKGRTKAAAIADLALAFEQVSEAPYPKNMQRWPEYDEIFNPGDLVYFSDDNRPDQERMPWTVEREVRYSTDPHVWVQVESTPPGKLVRADLLRRTP